MSVFEIMICVFAIIGYLCSIFFAFVLGGIAATVTERKKWEQK